MNKCEKCGFMHYRTDPCRKRTEPVVTAPKPSRTGNRHRPGYFTDYMRKYRAEVKSGVRSPAKKNEVKK